MDRGARLDRLTHHVHILEMNGDSYRRKQSRRKQTPNADRYPAIPLPPNNAPLDYSYSATLIWFCSALDRW
jgi:hypothetical protein